MFLGSYSCLLKHGLYSHQIQESNEHDYQWPKAIDHDDEALAEEIRKTKSSYAVKKAVGVITTSDDWNRRAPGVLEELLDEKNAASTLR